jgi:hypothetical protein
MRCILFASALAAMLAPAALAAPQTNQPAGPAPRAIDGTVVPRRAGLTPAFRDDAEVIQFINTYWRGRWKEVGLDPAPRATDLEWCRRAYLDVIGRVPTIMELKHFQLAPAASKRAALLERLLTSREYTDEYARHWSTVWSNLLVGRASARDALDPTLLTSRDGFRRYLQATFAANKPYDVFVYELLTATGDTTPGQPEFNGAVNYLVDKLRQDAIEATAWTSQHFLGIRIQCAQCHNFPCRDWRQEHFWKLNAFFRQAKLKVMTEEEAPAHAVLRDADFIGEAGTPREAEIYFELRNGWIQAVYPEFLTGEKIDPNGTVAKVHRRRELARLVIQDDYFTRAITNRIWAHFLRYGFTEPVDDLGPHNHSSHYELCDRLGREFAADGYDLKRLIRWVTLSEPYGLSSRVTPKNRRDDPTLGERPQFAHFYIRQMQPEQLYDSIVAATIGSPTASSPTAGDTRRDEIIRQLAPAFREQDELESNTFEGTIQQMLALMNGELTTAATSIEHGSFLHTLVTKGKSEEDVIEQLFLASLGHKPSPANLAVARALLKSRRDPLTGYQDIWWALLNSNEFIFVH